MLFLVYLVIKNLLEKLTDNFKSLSNFEILTIQLKEFEKFFEEKLFGNRNKNY